MTAEYDPITADIGRKCSDDVSAAIRRNMLLMQDNLSAAQVAVIGAGGALGMAAGAMCAHLEELAGAQMDNEGIADALWDILRPMCLASLAALHQSALGQS